MLEGDADGTCSVEPTRILLRHTDLLAAFLVGVLGQLSRIVEVMRFDPLRSFFGEQECSLFL